MDDQSIGVLVVSFVLAQVGLWADGRRQRHITDAKIDEVGARADSGTEAARLAAKRSLPTANGFAEDVRDGLATVIHGQEQVNTRLEKVSEELGKVADRLNAHIGDHASRDTRRA